MTKALFRLFILFMTCSTAISCSEQDSPDLPDNPGNTNQGIASIDQTQINANGGGFSSSLRAADSVVFVGKNPMGYGDGILIR